MQKGGETTVITGYERDFYDDISAIRKTLAEINISLQSLTHAVEELKEK